MNRIEQDNAVHSCTLRLRAILGSLKSAERRVADYILEHPSDVMNSTINELADKTGTSYATITRLIRKIGFSGFRDMKKSLYEDTLSNTSLDTLNTIVRLQENTSDEICRNLYQQCIGIMDACYRQIDLKALENAADIILKCHELNIIGTGLSAIIARYAYLHFLRIGLNVHCDEDATTYKMRASLMKEDDVLFVVSSSGRSSNILECAGIAQKNGTQIIALCDYAISPLSQTADVALFTTPRNVSQFMDIDMPLIQGQLFLLDTLYFVCCMKMGKKASELYSLTRQATALEKKH